MGHIPGLFKFYLGEKTRNGSFSREKTRNGSYSWSFGLSKEKDKDPFLIFSLSKIKKDQEWVIFLVFTICYLEDENDPIPDLLQHLAHHTHGLLPVKIADTTDAIIAESCHHTAGKQREIAFPSQKCRHVKIC